jgi:hypothetical protein
MLLLGNEQRIHLTKIKELKWFKQYLKENKKEKKKRKSNDESINNISNVSISTQKSKINDSINENTIKSKPKEETIITDEEYLELYQKEKEVLLGLIAPFDKEEFIQSLYEKRKYKKNNDTNDNSFNDEIEESTTTNDEIEKPNPNASQRRRNMQDKGKNTFNFRFWKCQ